MPPGMLFAVYDSHTGNPDYIPPEYIDISGLLDELVEYVNTTDDHPLIVAAVVLILAGVFNGSARDVLYKAITICSECVGLG